MAKVKNKRNAGLADRVHNKKKQDANKKKLNPFEVHINKEKIKVLGKKSKHDRGLPGVSRAKAIQKRKETLGTEMKLINKTNTFIDRRIGEKNNQLSSEDRMIARFAAERAKQHNKKSIYNLADDEILTHRGQTLEQIEKFDDPKSSDDEDDGKHFGGLGDDFVSEGHFGGGILSKSESKDGAKSHKDLIEQLIAESKKRKAEKQKEKEQTLDLTEKLDSEWKDLKPVVFKQQKEEESLIDKLLNKAEKGLDYDKMMRELKFEKRGTPSDGLKSKEKQEEEERKKIAGLEKERELRMLSEEEFAAPKKNQASKHRSADDLDDNFELDNEQDFMLAYDKDGKPLVPDSVLKDFSVPNANKKFDDGISDTSNDDSGDESDDESEDNENNDRENNKNDDEKDSSDTDSSDEDNQEHSKNVANNLSDSQKKLKDNASSNSDESSVEDNDDSKNEENDVINSGKKSKENDLSDSDDSSEEDIEEYSKIVAKNVTNPIKKSIKDVSSDSDDSDSQSSKEKVTKLANNVINKEISDSEDSSDNSEKIPKSNKNNISNQKVKENGLSNSNKIKVQSKRKLDEDENIESKKAKKLNVENDDESDEDGSSSDESDDENSLDDYNDLKDSDISEDDVSNEKIGSFFDFKSEEGDNLKKLLTGKTPSQQSDALQKLIKSYDPSLSENNKDLLSRLFAHLLQYIHDIFSNLNEESEIIKAFLIFDKIVPYLYDIIHVNKVSTKKFFVELLKEKHDSYKRNTKKVPDLNTLIFFKLVSLLYPTSDFRHPVATPSLIFMSEILTLSRFRDSYSISRGLFIVALILEYTVLSKNYVPSAVNFLRGIIYLSANTSVLNPVQVIPPFRLHKDVKILNLERDCSKMAVEDKMAAKDLIAEIDDSFKIRCLSTSTVMLQEFFNNYIEFEALAAIFEPHIQLLSRVDLDLYPKKVAKQISKVIEYMKQTLEVKTYTLMTREKVRPKALRLYEPDVQEVFTGSKNAKLSKEGAEKARLQGKYKKEMKGALREIRRDKAYIASVKIRQKIQSDNIRKEKVKQIYKDASIQQSEINKLKRMK